MIGDNIRRIRKSRNLLQRELGEMIHVKAQTISSWEINRTEPNMGAIEALAAALNCRKSDIIGDQTGRARADVHQLTADEKKIILAYRIAPESTKDIIRKILDVGAAEGSDSLTEAG